MIQRARQFYRAMTNRLSKEDLRSIQLSLSKEAYALFAAMHPVDQYHAYRVAMTAHAIAREKHLAVDEAFLRRTALLHDVGRRQGDLDIWGKVVCVLLAHFFPRFTKAVGAKRTSTHIKKLDRALYVYVHHAEIGARLLETIGLLKEAKIVRLHHSTAKETEGKVLKILRMADERN